MLQFRSATLVAALALGTPLAFAQSSPTLDTCQQVMATQSASYERSLVQIVGKCLAQISSDVVQKGATVTAAADRAAARCTKAFSQLADTGADKGPGARFDAKVDEACVSWDATLGAANLGDYCETLGGDGSVDSFGEWKTCVRAAADAKARDAIATRWPRALEYFEALVAALPTGPARDVLDALDAEIEGPVDDDKPDPAETVTGLVATGATLCKGIPAELTMEACPHGPHDQDGLVRAGFDVHYIDNGDGTITDHRTGLTWEKHGDDGSIHDQSSLYTFADAVGVKIASLNAGTGFAGHTDWRLPNRRELESLVDSGRSDLAVRPVFDDSCAPGCSSVACSCTLPEAYWTSTAYQADPSKGWVVDFYETDVRSHAVGAQAHVRAVRGGVHVAAAPAPVTAPIVDKAPASLAACQKTVATQSAKYLRNVVATVGKCLGKMSDEILGDGGTAESAAQTNASACAASFGKLLDTASPERTLAGKFDAKVSAKCDPASNEKLSHAEVDTWTIGARTLSAANLAAYCAQLGGDGSIESFAEWRTCVRTVAEAQAREAIALRWPRALEYFGALEGELAGDARTALVALDRAIDGATKDDKPEPPPPPPAGLLVTGQTQCVQDGLNTLGSCPGGFADQDGALRVGVERRYTDNGDGTITDEVTGLMWEKLSDDDSIHDRDHDYDPDYGTGTVWSGGAHYNKVARLNRYSFAGYTDWRVPNRRELESLVDAGRTMPAIDPIFETDCTPGCSVLECSCTASKNYMTSTFTPYETSFGTQGWTVTVNFGDGAVGHIDLYGGRRVRGVRGGNGPLTTYVDQAPTAVPIDVKFPWDQECNPITLIGHDIDSSLVFFELVSPPTNGYLTEFVDSNGSTILTSAAAQDTLPPFTNGQITAAIPDNPWLWWSPYNYEHTPGMGTVYLDPQANPPVVDPTGYGITMCYVTFSTAFVGTDSFTYRLSDHEGKVSDPVLSTITVFEVP